MNDRLKFIRPTYACIDTGKLTANIRIAKKLSRSELIAIVKADAYGHGALETAIAAYSAGVTRFGVATVSEGLQLASKLPKDVQIIILGYVDPMFYPDVVEERLIITIYNIDVAKRFHEYLTKIGGRCRVSIKIDTGMGRLGFGPELDLGNFRDSFPLFEMFHTMSHLAASDEDDEYTLWQENRFKKFTMDNSLTDTSLYNSSAISRYNNTFPFTRPGLLLYGYVAGASVSGLEPVMSILSKPAHIFRLSKGMTVSYNRLFKAAKDMWAAVIPIGYADGYRREFSDKAVMYVDGFYCPVIGRVCMDMTMIDVSVFGENVCGKTVEIMGEHVTAHDLAKLANTAEYEILCGISYRIPRVYD
jgi:alanine racemase